MIFDQTEIGRTGAFVTLNRYDALEVYRGYMLPEDEPVEETTVQEGTDPAVAGQGMIVISPMAMPVPLISKLSSCRVASQLGQTCRSEVVRQKLDSVLR